MRLLTASVLSLLFGNVLSQKNFYQAPAQPAASYSVANSNFYNSPNNLIGSQSAQVRNNFEPVFDDGFSSPQGPGSFSNSDGNFDSDNIGSASFSQESASDSYTLGSDADTLSQESGADSFSQGRGADSFSQGSGSDSFSQGSGSTSFSQGSGSNNFAQGGGSAGFSQGRGSSNFAQGSGQSSFAQGSGPSSFAQGSGSSSFSQGSGSGSFPKGGGSTSFSQGSGSTSFSQGSGSAGFSQGSGSAGFGAPAGNFGSSSSSGASSSNQGLDVRQSSASGQRGSVGGSGSFNGQGARAPANAGVDFSQAERTPDGRLCVIKFSEVETLAKDPLLECIHKDVQKCHYSYVTYFKPAQEEVCEENFEKLCQITFKKQSTKETVQKCYKPQQKVCNGQGPEECRTVYETSCTTKYVAKGNGKTVGDTNCEKLPVEICGAGCTTEEGPEECHDKEIDTLIDVPEEVCDLNPQKSCRFITRLVPSLKPVPECTTIPQEVCNLKFTAPRKEKKPIKSEWCLDESEPVPDDTYDAEASEPIPSYYGVVRV